MITIRKEIWLKLLFRKFKNLIKVQIGEPLDMNHTFLLFWYSFLVIPMDDALLAYN